MSGKARPATCGRCRTRPGSSRIAAAWYSGGTFNVDLKLTGSAAHQLAVYCVDWDNLGRAETLSLLDGTSGATLDTRSISGFVNGVGMVWTESGHVVLRVNWTGGANAVISGLMFGPAITANQLMEITILHELAHFNGSIGNPDNQSVERRLWNDCIAGRPQ